MFAPRNLRYRGTQGLGPAALALAALLACATASPTVTAQTAETGPLAAGSVESEAEGTWVSLESVERPGFVESLGEVAELTATTVAEVDPWSEISEEPVGFAAVEQELSPMEGEGAELVVQAADAAVAVAPGAPATALLAVEPRGEGQGAVIELRADGPIAGHEHFVLDDPPRLVVDLPGLVSRVPSARISVARGGVSQVRVGQHEGKVRIVVDGSGELAGLKTASLASTPEGLAIALGGASAAPGATPEIPSEERAATEPASSAPSRAAEATPTRAGESAEVRVHGVQYDAQADRDRVVILTDTRADFALFEPDADTVIVRLFGASIEDDADLRIVPDERRAVGLVTAFQQPGVTKPEVRVVVRRAPGVAPTVSQEGTMLFLDFPQQSGLQAAAPPALQGLDSHLPAASTASTRALSQAGAAALPAALAAIDPDAAALDILQEGGLIEGKQYIGRRISLDFKDVDVDDVLRLIAEVSELNIVAGDEVSGRVTIRLVDVPWDQALDVILLTKGLGFMRVGNVLRIAPAQALKAEEEARLQERRAMEKLEDLVVKLQPVNYANVKDVEKMVKRLLTPRGSVDVDERTNTVILKDIPSVIDEATALVKAIDTQTPQVVIEAKIVEANLDYSRELGTSWGFGVQPFNDAFNPGSGLRRNETIGSNFVLRPQQQNPGFASSLGNNIAIANPISSMATGLLNLGAFVLDDRFNVDLQLQAAESHGEGKVISSPRIVTLDNRKASIEQGVSIPFQTFENGDAKLEFIDAVLRLEVTPHITADRSIIMKIKVQRNAPDDSVATPTGSPAIAKNEAETETLVKDGQTLVIGGIYVVRKSDRQLRVPYVHRIPVLGNAFKNNEVRDIRQELLVFVTPRVVVTPELGT
jgi:type IV pilus assembly protein PilQ